MAYSNPNSPHSNTLEHLRILVVDDQPDARDMLQAMLNTIGILQVYHVGNGQEALRFIDEAPHMIDLIICDWNMPEMSGLDLFRYMRSLYPSEPFLMVTGRKDMDSILQAKAYGVSAYIGKPFTPDQLEAKIRVVMYQYHTRAK